MVRIDMSEFQERHTVSRLVGAPRATSDTRRPMRIVRNRLRPEFVNRIDEIIVFCALDKEQIAQIARLLERAQRGLRPQGIEVEFTRRPSSS